MYRQNVQIKQLMIKFKKPCDSLKHFYAVTMLEYFIPYNMIYDESIQTVCAFKTTARNLRKRAFGIVYCIINLPQISTTETGSVFHGTA